MNTVSPRKRNTRKTATEDAKTPTPDRAWFEARLAERGLSKLDAARMIGVDSSGTNILWRIMSGDRPAKIHEAVALAHGLGTSVAGIIRRLGYDPPALSVPVIGTVRPNGYVSPLPPAMQKRTDAPDDSSIPYVALQVEGQHNALAVYDGAVLYYEPCDIVSPDAFGRLAVLELGDHGAPVVGRLDRSRIGTARIVLFGETGTIESEQLVSASPVRWVKCG